MKTWHQYFQNQSNKIIAGVLSTLALSLPLSVKAEGILNNFKALSEISAQTFENQKKILETQKFTFKQIKNIDSVSLNNQYLNYIYTNTPSRFLNLGKKDRCSYYDLILSNLLRDSDGEIDFVIFDYQNQQDQWTSALASRKDFKENIIIKQCPGSIKLSQYFNTTNVKNTLTNLNIMMPTNVDNCNSIFKSFIEDVKSPYLCSIHQSITNLSYFQNKLRNTPKGNRSKRIPIEAEIRKANQYKSIVSPGINHYFGLLCKNIEHPQNFCRSFFSEDYWAMEAKNKKGSILGSFCEAPQSKKCIASFQSAQFCHFTKGITPNDSLKPWPNCEQIAEAQIHSRLFQSYNDCPAKVGNEDITTWARVLNHFNQNNFKEDLSCTTNSTGPVADFGENVSDYNSWDIRICYDDKIKREEVCYPTLLENSSQHADLSIATNIGKILKRLRGYNYETKPCRIVDQNEYKPTLLEFKNGCIILRESNTSCWGTECPFKVILDENEFTQFKFESNLAINVFPRNYLEEAKSFKKIIERNQKRTFKRILNVTALRNALTNNDKAIVYGTGCAEDLLPTFFPRESLNHCTPTPFIIDGLKSKDGLHSVIIRTSYDHINAPRMTPWSYVFNAVKGYQKLQPVNTWGLYAIQ